MIGEVTHNAEEYNVDLPRLFCTAQQIQTFHNYTLLAACAKRAKS